MQRLAQFGEEYEPVWVAPPAGIHRAFIHSGKEVRKRVEPRVLRPAFHRRQTHNVEASVACKPAKPPERVRAVSRWERVVRCAPSPQVYPLMKPMRRQTR